MRKFLAVTGLLSLLLAACGNNSPTPDAVQGTWGADCSKPFIKIDGSKIHVYPDDADYTVTKVAFDGTHLVLTYDASIGTVTETYVSTGSTLRLDHGHYNGMDAIWHKEPMQKC